MTKPAGVLAELEWLLPCGEGNAVSIGVGGERRECTTTPPLADAIAAARASAEPQRVALRTAGEPERFVEVFPVPGRDDVLAAVSPDIVHALAAPAIEALVNQIAHDVRNYAFTMGLQAEMGARRAATIPEVQGNFDAVLRQVDGLKRYLEQLLLFGRAPRLAPTPFDAGTFIREQVQRLQFGWTRAEPPLSIDVRTPAACPVQWDQRAIAAALDAVLDNAVRSADPPPPVQVSVCCDGARVVLEVADRGAGIPADVLARLRVPMSARRAGAAGLGVAIARKMVEAHAGRFEIASSPDGTTVRFDLPREADPA